VATGTGLQLVDVSDPMVPRLLRTVNVNATRVEVFQGTAYISVGGSVSRIDLLTGETIQTLSLGNTITDLTREDTFLYSMDNNRFLRAIDTSSGQMVLRGSLQLPHGGGQLFVGNGIAYAAATSFFRGGFATANVSNPDSLTLISGSDVVAPTVLPATAVVANGSGLGLLIGT